MPRITVPVEKDPLVYRVDRAGAAADRGGRPVQQRRLREVVAVTARVRGRPASPWPASTSAPSASDWRTARDVPGRSDDPDEIPESFYEEVGRARQSGRARRAGAAGRRVRRAVRRATTWAWTTPSGIVSTTTSATTSWWTWPCAWGRGWPWAGSTRSSTSTAPAGSRPAARRAGPRTRVEKLIYLLWGDGSSGVGGRPARRAARGDRAASAGCRGPGPRRSTSTTPTRPRRPRRLLLPTARTPMRRRCRCGWTAISAGTRWRRPSPTSACDGPATWWSSRSTTTTAPLPTPPPATGRTAIAHPGC